MSGNHTHSSIRNLIASVTATVWIFVGSLFVGLALLFTLVTLSDSHTALCSMVETKLDAISGPLSRELALGQQDTSQAIFNEFAEELDRTNIKRQIHLSTEVAITREQTACTPHFFSVTLNYPLQFGGVRQAAVQGTLSYFSLSKILVMIGLILALLFVLSRTLLSKLMRELDGQIITPLLALSKGESLSSETDQPTEVLQIQKNLDQLKKEILDKERMGYELVKVKEIAKLASGVGHDIRSPVTALAVLANPEVKLSEESKNLLIRSATTRILDIANDLLVKRRKLLSGVGIDELKGESVHLVAQAIESIVSEARLEHRSKHGVEISSSLGPECYGLFIRADLSDFKRTLSNIINNAIESIHESGKVTVKLQYVASRVHIVIEDNGKGISENRIALVTEEGATSDKPAGNALGLAPAKNRIASWGGKISISSKQGVGTKVSIDLPAVAAPSWFAPQLEIAPGSSIIICDDDLTIHHVWDNRFKALHTEKIGVRIEHFRGEEELRDWHSKYHQAATLYLIDYELSGSRKNGIDLIESLNIPGQAVLVTSHAEEATIIEKCKSLGIKLLPKSLAGWVPFATREQATCVDGILIEDDEALGIAWKTSAESRGRTLHVFRSGAPFMAIADSIDRDTPVYIDANLGETERGEEVAKALHELGFQNLYITTGEPIEDRPPWLKGVVDKTPPWLSRLERLSG